MYLTKSKRSPFYQLVYFRNGKRTSVSTGKRNKSEAIQFLKTFKVQSLKPLQKNTLKLTDFENKYLTYIMDIKSKSYIKSIRLSFRMLMNYSGDVLIDQINKQMVESFILSTFRRSGSAAGLYFRTLKAAFTKAIDWDLIEAHPFKSLKLPKQPSTFPVFINDEEFTRIISATKDSHLCDLFTTAYFTGMRLGEIVNMKWDWIDKDFSKIIVTYSLGFTTKSRRERIIPVHSELKSILKKRYSEFKDVSSKEYVFYKHRNFRFNEDYISKKFKAAVREVGLDDKIKFHTLRDSFASRLVQKEVSLYVIKELLGHTDIKTTLIYAHLSSENFKNAIDRL
jgi:integrase